MALVCYTPGMLKKVPKARRDGRCYTCKGERPPAAVSYEDPFCSADCARAYYGNPAPPPGGSIAGRKKKPKLEEPVLA